MDEKLNPDREAAISASPAAMPSRFRFSLQAMFIATTVFAGFCYQWFVLPSIQANRLVSVINAADYASADNLFGKSGSVSFAKTNEKTFGFRANASLIPSSLGDVCWGRRSIQVETDYMAFDEHMEETLCVVATPFGLKQPVGVSRTGSMMIDRSPMMSRIEIQR